MEANYRGFVLETEERIRRGFPIDRTTLVELAEKYGIPILGDVSEKVSDIERPCGDCIMYRSFPDTKAGNCKICVMDLTEEDCMPPVPKSHRYVVELTMTPEFVKRWITENPFFGPGDGIETEYVYGYIRNAMENYIANHLPNSRVEGIEFTVRADKATDKYDLIQAHISEAGKTLEAKKKLEAINHFLKKVRERDEVRVDRSWVITSLEKILEGAPQK